MPQAPEHWPTLPAMMLSRAAQWADRPLFRYWHGGAWRSLKWGDFAVQTASVAAFLRARGIGPGDRVLLVSENRPEFPIADTAIMAIGAITVPTYTTNLPGDHAHILRDSGARVAIVSTRKLAERVLEGAALADGLDLLICVEDPPSAAGLTGHRWDEAIATPGDVAMLAAETAAMPADSLACLIYTSGTGGLPKGVMLPHRALLANRAGVVPLVKRLGIEGRPYLSFLPLSHAYEHTVGGFLLPSAELEVVYSRGADRLSHELAEIKPAILTAVPRLFELLRARILAGLEKETPFKRSLFDKALALGLRKMDGPPLGLFEKMQDLVLDRLVRQKMRDRFGGQLRAMVSGGARLDPDLSGFFIALGLPVIQGYGQTEAGPVISVNLPWDNHRHTVGPPLRGVECRIAEDGEVLVRGDLVMTGYWNNPEATAAALQTSPGEEQPWLHTGDVGVIEDGSLRITDRKRDFIKTLGGDMVSPAKVECLLMAEPEIHQALVAGEGKAALVALLVPADGMAEKVGDAVRRVNAKLPTIERIRHFSATEAFTIENGLLTPTRKVKRRAVIEARGAEVEGMYR